MSCHPDGRRPIGCARKGVYLSSSRSPEGLPWIEGVARSFADEDRAATASPTCTTKAVSPSQGACRLDLPWLISSPSEAEPGGRPKPRKSSEVSVVIEPDRMNGRNVSVATMALGSRCRNIIVRLFTPSARAARTYSKLRARKNSARTMPTKPTQENRSMMPSRMKKPGGRMAAMIKRM